MKIYVANSLFSQADRDFNDKLVRVLREKFPNMEFYLPQENMGINDKSKTVTSQDIFRADTKELLESDFIIACLDGVEADSGVCCEAGIAYASGKKVFGLLTDIRFNNDDLENKMLSIKKDSFENPVFYRNLYLIGLIKESGGGVYNSIESLIENIYV